MNSGRTSVGGFFFSDCISFHISFALALDSSLPSAINVSVSFSMFSGVSKTGLCFLTAFLTAFKYALSIAASFLTRALSFCPSSILTTEATGIFISLAWSYIFCEIAPVSNIDLRAMSLIRYWNLMLSLISSCAACLSAASSATLRNSCSAASFISMLEKSSPFRTRISFSFSAIASNLLCSVSATLWCILRLSSNKDCLIIARFSSNNFILSLFCALYTSCCIAGALNDSNPGESNPSNPS